MKIALFDVHDWEKAQIKKQLSSHTVSIFSEPFSKKHLSKIADAEIISCFVHSKLENTLLDKMPHLVSICVRSTGFDNIDLAYCKKRNIAVSNVPFYGANSVAEYTFALLLSVSRKIHQTYMLETNKNYTQLTGFDLQDKTIGIIGGGHIGQHTIRIAKGFGMNVLVYDVHPDNFLSRTLGFTYTALNTLLKKSDVISLHIPDNKFTHHILNKDNMGLLKKGVILLNTSRGGIIETEALLKYLKNGTIAFAGLDVIESEMGIIKNDMSIHPKKLARNREVIEHPNVLFTPHNAFNSTEALGRILQTSLDNILAASKKKPQNKVN